MKIFGVFRVKNHDFTPKNHIFSNFRGGGRVTRTKCPPSAPGLEPLTSILMRSKIAFIFHVNILYIFTHLKNISMLCSAYGQLYQLSYFFFVFAKVLDIANILLYTNNMHREDVVNYRNQHSQKLQIKHS